MRKFALLLAGLLLFALSGMTQKNIQLRNGTIKPVENITEAFTDTYNSTSKKIDGRSWILLQFRNNPTSEERMALKNAGVELLQYIPHNIFVAIVTSPLNAKQLKKNSAVSIIELQPEQKIDAGLLSSRNSTSPIEVMVALFDKTPFESAEVLLNEEGFSITHSDLKKYGVVQVAVPPGKLLQLASLPFIQTIEAVPPPMQDLNFNNRNATKANILGSRSPGGYNLTGEGVTIAVAEVQFLHDHADFKDRLIGPSYYVQNTVNTFHSTHVHGIVGGAGLVYEPLAGFAPKSKLLTMAAGNPIGIAGTSAAQGMVISNNSYGTSIVCTRQPYSLQAFSADRDAFENDFVLHVFGAGNSGNSACLAYPPGYSTMGNLYQIGKSTITVGNILPTGELAASSSRGPAPDGRLKPELVAIGTNILSTVAINAYGYNSGTSMSSPAVAGGLGLLYQRYRQLHNGLNPKNSLMKAILLNTATDLGNKGPDYGYGFGAMNLLRAVNVLDKSAWFYDSVIHQSSKTHTINVPSGTSQLKVMLYWQDPATSSLSAKVLVNDLDLEVATPSSGTVLPYVLDTLPSLVANPAKRGEDHLNNIEQVVIDNPAAGSYSIKVKGTEVGLLSTQSYAVVYDIVIDDARLTFPFGGESLVPGENVNIQWDSWGHNTSTFHLQYSPDDGNSWQTIDASIAADKRQYNWTVPSAVTNKARIRLTRNEDAITTTSNTFIILGQPLLALSLVQCPEYITIEWSPVAGATDYEVMMARHGELVSVDIVAGTISYVFRNLSMDSTYLVTVRPRLNGVPGRRAVAVSRKPDSGTCAGNVSDHDLKPAVVSPVFGRQQTSRELTTHETVTMRIINLDDAPVTGFSVSYSVDNGPWISESSTVTIPSRGEVDKIFATTYDFSAIRNYSLKVVVKTAGDINELNDTVTYIVRNVANPVLNLADIPSDSFEQIEQRVYAKSNWAFVGAERIDYEKEGGTGSFSINVKATTGPNQQDLRLEPTGNGNQYITGTYNLSAYDTAFYRVGLDFLLSKIDNRGESHDTLYIRGKDTEPWITVLPIDPGFDIYFTNKLMGPILVTDYLKAAHQNYSSSFQVRISQVSSVSTYLMDDIRLYNLTKDAGVISIDSLRPRTCAAGNALPVRITIENRSGVELVNVPVKYKINNGTVVTETVTIPAATTMSYTFNTKADLSAFGEFTIEAWTDLPGDTYTLNDRKSTVTRNHPLITSLPYLENFESGQNSWYSEGVNSTWQYGTPSSTLVTGAASGNKAWKTNLTGRYNNNENSYLYSPCFDISTLTKPMISLSIALNTDSCTICDFGLIQASMNGGITWTTITSTQQAGYNWPNLLRSRTYYRWHVASMPLKDTIEKVQFRILFRSDAGITGDGIAVDDVHIYDSTAAIYDNNTNSNVVSKVANGNDWVDFTENGKLLVSIHPRGQNLGNTTVQSFWRPGSPNFHGQYYLKRNFNIQSANALNDSVSVRLYVLDRETDSLLFAYNCPGCMKPANAYQFGVSQYTSPKPAEYNDWIIDDIKGDWKFITPAAVKTVPYQKGYYLEFKTSSLSEFWLNNGGYNKNSYLPVKFNSFSTSRTSNNNGELRWETASEINIQRFEIEVAKGNDAYLQDSYVKLADVASGGASASAQTYQYTDAGLNKKGAYYYRIKAIDIYGNYSYSKAQPVVYDNEYVWHITPNHSGGLFNLVYQVNAGDDVSLQLFNSAGSLIKTEQFSGNGFIDQHAIDLRNTKYAGGLYFVRVNAGGFKGVFRIVKQ